MMKGFGNGYWSETTVTKKNGEKVTYQRFRMMIDGKEKSFYGTTKKAATIKKDKFLKAEAHTDDTPTVKFVLKKQSVTEYATHFIDLYKKGNIRTVSLQGDEGVVSNMIRPFPIGAMKMSDVRTDDVQKYIQDISTVYGWSSCKKAVGILKQIFRHAVAKDGLDSNPCEGTALPKRGNYAVKEKVIVCFTEEQRDAFVEESKRLNTTEFSTNGPAGTNVYGPYRNLYVFLLNSGMRIGEALALHWEDIDFDAKTIRITRSGAWVESKDKESRNRYAWDETTGPKTKKGERTVPLNSTAEEAVNTFVGFNKSKFNKDHVFASETGKIPSRGTLTRGLKAIEKRAGLPLISLHDLRHSFASILIEKGADAKTVSELLGHASVTFTMDRYVHTSDKQKKEAVSLIG